MGLRWAEHAAGFGGTLDLVVGKHARCVPPWQPQLLMRSSYIRGARDIQTDRHGLQQQARNDGVAHLPTLVPDMVPVLPTAVDILA